MFRVVVAEISQRRENAEYLILATPRRSIDHDAMFGIVIANLDVDMLAAGIGIMVRMAKFEI